MIEVALFGKALTGDQVAIAAVREQLELEAEQLGCYLEANMVRREP